MNATKQMFYAAALSIVLSACGGGGSPTVDNSKALDQAISNISVPGVGTTPSPTYAGANVSVNGVNSGWVNGTSEDNVAMLAAKAVADNQKGNPDAYKALLSDAGLKVVVIGGLSNVKSGVTGLFIPLPDIMFVAKLTTTGLIVRRV